MLRDQGNTFMTAAVLGVMGGSGVYDLPGLEELKGAGLLSGRIPSDFQIPLPLQDDDDLAEDEDPLQASDLEELGILTPGGKHDE